MEFLIPIGLLAAIAVLAIGWFNRGNAGEDWCHWQCPNSGTCNTCDGWPGNEPKHK